MAARRIVWTIAAVGLVAAAGSSLAQERGTVLVGHAAMGDWTLDAPGVRRKITPADLPQPYATPSARNSSRVVTRPDGAQLKVPPGFRASLFAEGLTNPRLLRVAPNGDIFVAESAAGRVRVLRPSPDGASPANEAIFASGLSYPFGIAFFPATGSPQWVYVANSGSVVRFPYRSGDMAARGEAEVVVAALPTGGHRTRDIVFSRDGKMFVSVGSQSNVAQGLRPLEGAALARWEAEHGLGAAWGWEAERAAVLQFDADGSNRRVFASGIRNCVGMAIDAAGALWCSTNERDGLGDDLVPDYLTRVRPGAFYGWPWTYIGDNPDPRHRGQRPDLKGKVTVPDVLIQAHSASLQMAVYDGRQFPESYRGSLFAAQHGSWNRAKRTGYKIVRALVREGQPTGEYEDVVTGFVIDDERVWGRPVGVAVAKDGSLLFSEDGNGTIWRLSYVAGATPNPGGAR